MGGTGGNGGGDVGASGAARRGGDAVTARGCDGRWAKWWRSEGASGEIVLVYSVPRSYWTFPFEAGAFSAAHAVLAPTSSPSRRPRTSTGGTVFTQQRSWRSRPPSYRESLPWTAPAEIPPAPTGNTIAVHLLRCLENAPCVGPRRPRGSNTDSPLRIEYLLPDVFTHSVSYFEALLQKYDTTGFKVYAYANVAQSDPKTVRYQTLFKDRSRNICGLTSPAAAKLIVEDKIDILVELDRNVANNRRGVMALRFAPVRVSWIDYPNTTELKAIHYRVTDRPIDPLNTSQQFSKRLWRLLDLFLCYIPSLETPEQPCEPPLQSFGGIVTFGSFRVLAKVQ
ncbi:O-GlcNAc transferase [Gracilaria domingensis]|nr:O-GlcNAc transferase [Gracilaria domingensis]KAI0557492.1 O-GlcNAc transferase [Gracilaria domingensis]KAI0564148.1 O-GlcNAc transferase [Gracilaria domingensis]